MKAHSASRKASAASTEVPADKAREVFGDLLDRAGFRGERITITRHGKRVAALVAIDDLDFLNNRPAA